MFHGDQRAGRAAARWEPAAGGQGVVRVSSPLAIDEPMVTIYLRVGCGQSVTRRYVMLAEPPPEVEPARNPAPPPVAAARTPAAPRAETAAPAAATRPAATPAAPRAAATTRMQPATPTSRRAAQAAAPAQRQQPRLRLEPLDLGAEAEPQLRMAPTLSAQAPADDKQRQAATALWSALRKPPEEAAQEGLRLQSLEREMQSLRDLTQQNAAALAATRVQVEQARKERDQASVAIAFLLAGLAAVAAWVAWRWRGARRAPDAPSWFAGAQATAAGTTLPPRPLETAAGELSSRPAGLAPMPPATPPAPARAKPSPLPPLIAPPDFQPSHGASLRMVGVDELIDVQDKADFFLSIGKPQQAIEVLESHVHDRVETSALAWLDLLELYHSMGQREEFERLRSEFREHFTAAVPGFDAFGQPTAGLEDYPRALSRIVALWPSRKVLDVIEESLFRKPGLPGAEHFTLEAYRELVLLYHLIREIAPEEQESRGPATDFAMTSLHPLSMDVEQGRRELERLLMPPASPRIGVDIDLGGDDPPPAEKKKKAAPPPTELDLGPGYFDDVVTRDPFADDEGKPR